MLTEFCQENVVVIANTLFQQHKRWLYTWTSANGQYRNQIDYILCSQRWRICVQSAKTRPGADCGSNHQLLIAKLRLKLKKTGRNNRSARYDLNQIPYEFTVGVMNRVKGLDLVNSVGEELWREVVILYGRRKIKPSPNHLCQEGKPEEFKEFIIGTISCSFH